MWIESLQLGPLETNCWLVGDESGGPAVVIDPAGDAGAIVRALAGRSLEAIVLTHCHFDHIDGARGLIAATGAPLMVHVADADYLDSATGTGSALFGFGEITTPPANRTLEDGDTIDAGDVRLTVLHTPGHTPGSISLLTNEDERGVRHLFSGDTLFAGSVGRTDFPRGDGRALQRSIASKLAPLPPSTAIHPGHGPGSTIERESRANVFWPRA